VQWDWNKKLVEMGNWHLGGYWSRMLATGIIRATPERMPTILDIGFTPVFRIQQTTRSSVAPYVEAAVGLHLLSATSLNSQRQFGSSFQFGDHVGAACASAIKASTTSAIDTSIFQCGIKEPNQGVNYNELRLQYHF